MDCPKCGKLMEKGHLIGSNVNVPFYWLPEEHKNAYFLYSDKAVHKRNGLVFDKEFLERAYLEVNVCRKCGIGMFTFEP